MAALLAVPAAQGLFHRAIVQSGPPRAMPAERAAEMAAKLLGELDVAAVADLRRVPVTALLKAEASLYAQRPRTTLTLTPVVDGAVLQADPLNAIAAGAAADVPLLIGTKHRDEFKLFIRTVTPAAASPTKRRFAGASSGSSAAADVHLGHARDDRELSRHPRSAGPIDRSPRAVVSDRERPLVPRGLDPCRRGARGARAPNLQLPVHMGVAGDPRCARGLSCPGAALRLRHASLARRRPVRWRLSGSRRAGAGRMMDVWSTFARTGDPGWPAYDVARRATMVFGVESRVKDAPLEEEPERWDGGLAATPSK